MSDVEQLQAILDIKAPKVARNAVIVTPDQLPFPLFLHISKDTDVKKWVPVIGTRQADSEDRTTPRITVAPTILGCMIGYGSIMFDFQERKADGSKYEVGYKGGYQIYGFPFQAAIKPNKRLVFDQENSDEHWLVTYDKETIEFHPEKMGQMFYKWVRGDARNNELPVYTGELLVEVTYPAGFPFSKNHFLKPGHYSITGPMDRHVENWFDDAEFIIQPISRGEYIKAKVGSANLLSHQVKLPNFMQW